MNTSVAVATDYNGNAVPIRTVDPDFMKRGYKLLEIVRSLPAGTWYMCSDKRMRYKPWNT